MMAVLLSEKRDVESEPRDRDVLLALAVAVFPILIMLVQNDTGTVLILGSVALSIIAVSGARTRWVVGLIGGAVVGILLAIQLGLLKEYQVQRLTSFINPTADVSQRRLQRQPGAHRDRRRRLARLRAVPGPADAGQVRARSTRATSSSPWWGRSSASSGSAVLIAAAGRGAVACRRHRLPGRRPLRPPRGDRHRGWLAFQMFENIGMSLGIMPITGIPLPFVSAGGTSMLATWIAIGLLQNVHLHAVRAGV